MPARRRSPIAPSTGATRFATAVLSSSPLPPTPDDPIDAALLDFHAQVTTCRACPSIAPWLKFPLGRRGTARYRLMILGEAPGRVSLENGRPFSNPRNLTIRNAFAQAVAPLTLAPEELLYFSDTVKCWPSSPTGANRSPTATENATCVSRHLMRELTIVRPTAVFAIGARAAAAILGHPVKMLGLHGAWLTTPSGLRVLPLMHPSTINIAGMRKAGIRSLPDYEDRLAALFRAELRPLLADLSPAAS
ncbi:MAG TPA: uracil-DNA glycosylase family protein [Candidatus Binataceae bacterium]|nr:uracil-DNA glycosylase family protein [Candidatus Binataceae bacterium]